MKGDKDAKEPLIAKKKPTIAFESSVSLAKAQSVSVSHDGGDKHLLRVKTKKRKSEDVDLENNPILKTEMKRGLSDMDMSCAVE